MANYQEFRKKSRRRRMKRRLLVGVMIALAAVLLLGGAWLAFSGLNASVEDNQHPMLDQTPTQERATLDVDNAGDAAVPRDAEDFKVEPVIELSNWNTQEFTTRTLNYAVLGQEDDTTAMDFRLAAQPACGRVDLSFYDDVTFMGDSLTQGLEIYKTGLPNASYCAYVGVGPSAVVNGALCERKDRVKEVPLEALAKKAPSTVYLLYGTNVLTSASQNSQRSFLAYYDQMIDKIRETCPGVNIYVQSITPVRPGVSQKKPGLNKERLQRINDELAAMALNKGCAFLNLWEVLADEQGNLRAEFAQPDGYHVTPKGYAAWVEYLRTHTVYTPDALYDTGHGSWDIPA